MDLRDEIVAAYEEDAVYGGILAYLRSPTLGREKTFSGVSRTFYWSHMYKWVRKWVRICETCQRVKPSKSSQDPLRPLPIATEAWRSVSMDSIFGLPLDAEGRTGVLIFVDRFTKMVHLIPVSDTVTAVETAAHFIDCVFRNRGLSESIVSDRDPRFTSVFWSSLFQLLAYEPVTLNAVTRAKTKQALATPNTAASTLAAWSACTLIDPGNAGVPVAANYAPMNPARPVDNAAVSEFVLQRQSIAPFCA
ncbi:hypothetical protein PR003_g2168 [Phytophthora rubi]|uniref:Integrase zinc-binding domain-containing protein n=1 Tax=Phytophthora rubi TaxID=129364 RepID=A0A6A4G2S3_9STRA|nr:hypothetical protein PR003_g2168 [Phytophthora rubi]